MKFLGNKKEGRKEERKKKERPTKKSRLKFYLAKAGIDSEKHNIPKLIFKISIITTAIFLILSIYYTFQTGNFSFYYLFLLLVIAAPLIFIITILLVWLMLFIIIDIKTYKRKLMVEKVLPDFLQLTSTNIRSGMPIDKALWYSIRPRFGVLAKEIEIVAKQTMSGIDLNKALRNFSDRYDSLMLKRTISLIVEGLSAGGEIGDLLNRISLDIQNQQIIKKEMAAGVTSYVLFITFATVLAAPFLFGLTLQLLTIITKIMQRIGPTVASGSSFGFSKVGIKVSDFKVYAIISLIVTSFFSSMIIAIIKKGSAKLGFKYLIWFMLFTISLFFLFSVFLGKILGNII